MVTAKLNPLLLPATFAACLGLAACAQHQDAAPVPLATHPTVGQEVGAVAQNQVEIIFPNGGSQLTPEANRQLDLAARLFRDVNPVEMFSIGYTDPRGTELGNIQLSALRALSVKRGLIARGIPGDRVEIQALGASELANTGDKFAAENRRVVIKWRLL